MRPGRCFRDRLLLPRSHLLFKEAVTPSFERPTSVTPKAVCNVLQHKGLSSSQQHLVAEAPSLRGKASLPVSGVVRNRGKRTHAVRSVKMVRWTVLTCAIGPLPTLIAVNSPPTVTEGLAMADDKEERQGWYGCGPGSAQMGRRAGGVVTTDAVEGRA